MKKIIAIAIIAGFGLVSSIGPAFAEGSCLKTPEKTILVAHKAVTHTEKRWSRDVPAVEAVTHTQYQFSREIPGKDAVTHSEYQFSRLNPGQKEESHKEFKYSQKIPATDGVKEFEYTKCEDNYKTQYLFKKEVRGIIQQRDKGQGAWHATGEGFDWEWWVGNLTEWSDQNVFILKSGPHSAVQDQWNTWDGKERRKLTTEYRYVNLGQTRQVKDGTQTCKTDWFTSDPGSPWKATGKDRWKTEPQPEHVIYYNDGNWTKDIVTAPWVEIDKRKVIDQAAIDPFTEYKTHDGVSANIADADWFKKASFPNWDEPFNSRVITDEDATLPFTQYLSQNGDPTLNRGEAGWFDKDAIKGWTQFNTREKVDEEAIPGYTEYYVKDGDPTLELGDSNWTKDSPKGWTFVDKRKVTDKKSWTSKDVTPAVYVPCESLAFTGTDPLIPIGWGSGLIAAGLMMVGIAKHRRPITIK